MGFADELGSGVKNLYKYSKSYSGSDPELIENDIFKIIIPIGGLHQLKQQRMRLKIYYKQMHS